MRFWKCASWSLALCLGVARLQAQETNEVEALRRQLKEATENFEKTMREQRQIIDSLNQRLDALQAALTNQPKQAIAPPGVATNQPPPGAESQAAAAKEQERRKLEAELAAQLGANPAPTNAPPPVSFSPAAPLTIARAGSA